MRESIDDILARHRREEEARRRREAGESSGDALVSGLIAYGTNSALAGALIGGDVAGAVIGDLFNGGDLFD